MLPKRPPGSKVPHHVEQLAKHRHRGLDFIFVSQSPDKQCDQFVHDLIERHVHVKRQFGTKFVNLREFDRFQAQAEKATPLVIRRKKLPKRPMGLYKSTELDTTERRIPWYFIAFPIVVVAGLSMMYFTFGRMGDRLGGGDVPAAQPKVAALAPQDGALATGGGAMVASPVTPAEYATRFLPRIPSEPWSAPIYDGTLTLPSAAPRLFCMSSRGGSNAQGDHDDPSCTCVTHQGTRYDLDDPTCRFIARHGQFEPYRDERNDRYVDASAQIERGRAQIAAGQQAERGTSIARGERALGSFPESPGYEGAGVTKLAEAKL